MSVGNFQTVWVGWPGVYVDPGPDRDSLTATLARDRYVPVFLDPRLLDLHYNGFCNSVLWQLFHYVPLNIDSKLQETQTLQVQWQAHQEANRRFAEVVFAHYREGDVVWVQDYHLMLLPALLKMRKPKMKVGWFLHTPFPSSEIYRTLPVREEVLRAVLKADLIGFHTYDYARHFVSACTRILGLEVRLQGLWLHARIPAGKLAKMMLISSLQCRRVAVTHNTHVRAPPRGWKTAAHSPGSLPSPLASTQNASKRQSRARLCRHALHSFDAIMEAARCVLCWAVGCVCGVLRCVT